jgi:hypothetical protein
MAVPVRSLVIEPRYCGNHSPKLQAEFGVTEEQPDGPFQRPIQRYRQPFGHHVVGFQYPGTDRAHPEGTPVITKEDRFYPVLLDIDSRFYSPLRKHWNVFPLAIITTTLFT